MSKLYAFLHPEPIIETKDVFISDRFKDENGEVQPFTIKTLTQEELNRLTNKCRKFRRESGQPVEYLDTVELSKRIVLESVVSPDLRDSELCQAYGTLDPLELPGKLLRSGEYTLLMREISAMTDIDKDAFEMAKN